MIGPPIFRAVNVPAVQALLKTGGGPLRFYAFGQAPQHVPTPYAVWQLVYGAPENYLGNTPDIDGWTTQIDIYVASSDSADPAALAREIGEAIRDAIEPVAYIASWRGEGRDPETKDFVFSFDADWLVNR